MAWTKARACTRCGASTRWRTSSRSSGNSGWSRACPPPPVTGWQSWGAMADHPTPSEHARELVRGAVDYHVHVAPDFAERRITGVQLARRSKELGLGGFGLKSHYTATHERAAVVREAVPGVAVLGTVVLNRAIGGLNALAVEVAARQGARIVWFPTVSSVNEQREVLAADRGRKGPVWGVCELSLREAGADGSPVEVVEGAGELLPEAHAVLRVVAAHRLVLMTGHL